MRTRTWDEAAKVVGLIASAANEASSPTLESFLAEEGARLQGCGADIAAAGVSVQVEAAWASPLPFATCAVAGCSIGV